MSLYFVNRFYYPDISATSQMLTDLAEGLAEVADIKIVTAAKLYNDPLARLQRHEIHNGVEIFRLQTTRMGRASLWRRAVDYLSFYLRVIRFLRKHVREGDIVVLKTDPPLMPLLMTGLVIRRGGRVINWIQDLFPEVAMRLKVFPLSGWRANLVIRWRNRCLRKAAMNVAISEKMLTQLQQMGIQNSVYISNWADGRMIRPVDHADNPLREEWGLDGKFVVGYSGNFGRVHAFDAIVEAAMLLATVPDIHFLFIGEGAKLDKVESDLKRKLLTNVSFKPYQSQESLRYSLGAIDLHLISLQPDMEGLVLPSKIYGALAAARPLMFIGAVDAEIASLLTETDSGMSVPHDNGATLAEAIVFLHSHHQRLKAQGENARRLFDARFDVTLGIQRWRQLLKRL